MKQGDLKLGVEYAIIPSWDYSSAEKKDINKVRRRDVAKAKLVNLDKYGYEVVRSGKPDDLNFEPAEAGARSIGFLVESEQWATQGNGTVYWLSRPQDIVSEYAVLDAKWSEAEAEAKRVEEEMKRDQEERNRVVREAEERNERVSKSAIDSLRTIIGARADTVEVRSENTRNKSGDYVAVTRFAMDATTLQVLIEKVMEARDLAL